MSERLSDKEKEAKNPHEDSMVTDNMKGKKIDADPEDPKDQPSDANDLVTNDSQKGKKVDADPGTEQGVE